MILISSTDVKHYDILTPRGIEIAIIYLGKTFLATDIYADLKAAILACRRDLDAGLFSIVVKGKDNYQIWCPLPIELEQAFNLEFNLEKLAVS
ncbi:hypothetical protein Pse7367_2746 [Thalassoporum mexicanum PCC 7367]|uniref:hypothetical protein n=1 Tax=Thalassoporum mexicanum TaxID=3457544 RepID=UPI00029F87D9|nr:hypothetical protein [Pseudanabaena sp. PCC 7367]AFY71001.1 hypothetical protein Pse7367_2746 [Pseudanabaena sp. PCC 7367]